MRLGLLVNPIAGMGGAVGLKGTDDVARARELGAEPVARERALRFVEAVEARGEAVVWVTAGAPMGEDVLEAAGVSTLAAYAPGHPTTPADTRRAVEALLGFDVDLLVFVGGDGTAADVAQALSGRGDGPPVLGVPSGVKMYSAVFAGTPEEAASVALAWDDVEEREVLDIDEEAYRRDQLEVKLEGVLRVPVHGAVQAAKDVGASPAVEREAVAEAVAERVREEPGVSHVLGAGSTFQAVKEALGFEGTLLGFDVWREGEVVVRDAAERDLLEVTLPARVWVTPLGGQGFVLGRGTQQVSPAVLRRVGVEHVTVAATASKVASVGELRVDTGNRSLDEAFPGFLRVLTAPGREQMVRVRTEPSDSGAT